MQALIVILVLIIVVLVILCLKINNERKPAPKVVIQIYHKVDEFHYVAKFRDGKEDEALGDTFYQALGDLLHNSPDLVNIKVEYLGNFSAS